MVSFRDLVNGLRKLEVSPSSPVIAHASLSAFGEVRGGSETLLGALLSSYQTLVMPVFTYKTMVTPETGPEDNGLAYGTNRDQNLMAEFFSPDMPADRMMGAIAEALRQHPKAQRSTHPILSFAGINADAILETQTLEQPLEPIRALRDANGFVLLLGVDHTVNTSIHFGERLSRRKQFVRWALTQRGIVECPAFPGCSDGFNAIAPLLEDVTRQVTIGAASVKAIALSDLLDTACALIAGDPQALLCEREVCERCQSVRNDVSEPAMPTD